MAIFITNPSKRYWWLLASSILAVGSSYAALVFASASWADIQLLNRIYPDEGMCVRQFSAASWLQMQRLAIGCAFLLGLAWLCAGPGSKAGRQELKMVGAALRQLLDRGRQLWQDLTLSQQRFFIAHLILLTATRLYLSRTLLWHDDGASFALFVQHGLLAVAAYYPVPNNHVLLNILALCFKQVYPEFWWCMRLPVLLISTAGTLVFFGVALRRLGYWPALLAAGATSWLYPSLYYAANGRGYWILLLLTGGIFWAVLALLDKDRPAYTMRLPWLILVGAGILGNYAVPTFAYVLASAWSWLGLAALRRGQWQLWWQVLASGVLVGVGTGLFYAPLLYVSGLESMLANPYVLRLPAIEFWCALPTYIWFTESYLGGQHHVGALVLLAGLCITSRMIWQAKSGSMSTSQRSQLYQVGMPALWFVLFPYALFLGQHVLPPERVLLYKAWFGFLLLAVWLAVGSWPRSQRWLLGVTIAVVGLYQVVALLGDNRRHWLFITHHRIEYDWLTQHSQVFFPPGRVVPPCTPPPSRSIRN